jgi:hypothetical protein
MDCLFDRGACCKLLKELDDEGKSSVSANGVANVANKPVLVHASDNIRSSAATLGGLSAEDDVKVRALFELEERKDGDPFIRLDTKSYDKSKTTKAFLLNEYRPAQSNANITIAEQGAYPELSKKQINDRKGARALLRMSGALVGRTEGEKLKMVEGGVSAMTSWDDHVATKGGVRTNWWEALIANGVLVKESEEHKALKELSKQYMRARWVGCVTAVHVPCGMGDGCRLLPAQAAE